MSVQEWHCRRQWSLADLFSAAPAYRSVKLVGVKGVPGGRSCIGCVQCLGSSFLRNTTRSIVWHGCMRERRRERGAHQLNPRAYRLLMDGKPPRPGAAAVPEDPRILAVHQHVQALLCRNHQKAALYR